MNYIAGIDEAGRGAVIGPMVISIAFCQRANERKLNTLCKKDSKQLTPRQREEIFAQLKTFCNFKWFEISAHDLTNQMSKESLNEIEARIMATLIKTSREAKDSDITIDLPDRYEWTFRSRMARYGVKKFEAQHKADENFPIVAAASICAKILRDRKIEEIRAATCEFGSGYPSDERTTNALRNHETAQKLKAYVRLRWKTLDSIKQRKLFED